MLTSYSAVEYTALSRANFEYSIALWRAMGTERSSELTSRCSIAVKFLLGPPIRTQNSLTAVVIHDSSLRLGPCYCADISGFKQDDSMVSSLCSQTLHLDRSIVYRFIGISRGLMQCVVNIFDYLCATLDMNGLFAPYRLILKYL
jgi:hypothetical protein